MSNRDGWPPKEWNPILIEVGKIVFNWNTLERTISQILNTLVGEGDNVKILVTQLGNRTVTDSIKTFANEFFKGKEREHLLHSVELFDILRGYRNYYIHSFNGVSTQLVEVNTPSGPITAWDSVNTMATFSGLRVRKKLEEHKDIKRVEDIKPIALLLKDANTYCAKVSLHFKSPDKHNLPDSKFKLPKRIDVKFNPINI